MENPIRFAKQLAQLHRVARRIGLSEADAARLVIRVATES